LNLNRDEALPQRQSFRLIINNGVNGKGMQMKILIADDHGVVRQGLKVMIEAEDRMQVIGEASDGHEIVQLARQLSPDIILMDIAMPNLNGVEATRFILEENPNIRVIALSVHFDKRFVTEMLKAGASGYILKSCLFDEVLRAIQTVSVGDYYLSPKITDVVVDDYKYYMATANKSAEIRLTPRERQIIQLLTEGKSTKQIALQLHLSPKTVDSNRREIMNKLDISNVAELTKYAIREGITSSEF
jgi:DNA-binding NarL/FixJ family response regulator